MSSPEGINLPSGGNTHNRHVADVMIETVEFLRTYQSDQAAAAVFWSRIIEEYTEQGQGYSAQEFEALSWEADIALGLLVEAPAYHPALAMLYEDKV